jgi:anaerobic selenocysteine-containing dehydrogenase
VLPGASSLEKEASYSNDQGRLQGTARAIPTPGEAMEDWQLLVKLGSALGLPLDYATDARVRADISRRYPDAKGLEALGSLAFAQRGCRSHVAAGFEPVGAMEVGFHVSGSAAGERHCRPIGRAVDSALIPLREVK